MALQALGAEIKEHDGLIEARCRDAQGLKGTEIHLPYPSVGATEQAILASVLAKEVTVIHGAAKEPEISQLCRFLNNMGAAVSYTHLDVYKRQRGRIHPGEPAILRRHQ